MESSFLGGQSLYISKLLFISVTHLSRRFFRVDKRSCIHKLQLGSVNGFIAAIGLRLFTLNVMHLRKSIRDVLD